MVRAFIAIDLPIRVVEEIERIQQLLKKKTLFTGKLTDGENMHLTLKFLGEISEEGLERIREKLREIKFSKFQAELGEIGVFDKRKIRIVWIKLNGKGVFQLQKEIDKKLNDLFPVEARFMSHITIARVREVGDKKGFFKYLQSIKPRKIKFEADKFYFKRSELKRTGAEYTDIEVYNSVNL